MEYEGFVKELEEELQRKLENPARVLTRTLMKNNSVIRKSLSIMGEGENISPVIYLEDFYQQYQQGSSVEDLADTILKLYRSGEKRAAADIGSFTNWQRAKKQIVPRLVSRKKNKKLLEEVPHGGFLDLAVIYAFLFDDFGGEEASITVRNEHLEMWGVTAEEIENAAWENMDALVPFQFSTMWEVMNQMLSFPLQEDCSTEPKLYILTNRQKSYGAVWMCREDILAELDLAPGEDFYVLPSSVHECILMPKAASPAPEDLGSMVKEINATQVKPEEVLCDSVYCFSRKRGKLFIVS